MKQKMTVAQRKLARKKIEAAADRQFDRDLRAFTTAEDKAEREASALYDKTCADAEKISKKAERDAMTKVRREYARAKRLYG